MDSRETHEISFISKNYAFSSIVADISCSLTCKMAKSRYLVIRITPIGLHNCGPHMFFMQITPSRVTQIFHSDIGINPAIRLSPILVPISYRQKSKHFCRNSGSIASRLPVDWKQSRHPVSITDSLSMSSRPTTLQRRMISAFTRGRCFGSACAGSGKSVIDPPL